MDRSLDLFRPDRSWLWVIAINKQPGEAKALKPWKLVGDKGGKARVRWGRTSLLQAQSQHMLFPGPWESVFPAFS